MENKKLQLTEQERQAEREAIKKACARTKRTMGEGKKRNQ